MSADPPKIALIGAGKAGTQLGRRLAACGLAPVQVFSRKEEKARHLAEAVGASFTNDLAAVVSDADVYLIAVHDDAIAAVAGTLSTVLSHNPLVAHISGATPSTVLAAPFPRYGVFYPLQTFSEDRTPDFSKIPICIHAPAADDLALLKNLAERLSDSVHVISDEQRAALHIAAVFVNNFVNHLYGIGYRLLTDKGLPFELLLPLIQETAQRVQPDMDPSRMQTGPAARGDHETIARHLDSLRSDSDYHAIYLEMSQSILTLIMNSIQHADRRNH